LVKKGNLIKTWLWKRLLKRERFKDYRRGQRVEKNLRRHKFYGGY